MMVKSQKCLNLENQFSKNGRKKDQGGVEPPEDPYPLGSSDPTH